MEEFSDWVTNDEEIQDFLVEYMGYQTRTHAMKVYQQIFEKFMSCATNASEVYSPKEEVKSPASNLVFIYLFNSIAIPRTTKN